MREKIHVWAAVEPKGLIARRHMVLAVYSRRSPVWPNLPPVPEKRVSIPDAPVINAGWTGKLQRSPITILKRGDPVPAAV
ncbi:hypothetical protein SLA2020_286520 [Shorea laevis]